MHNPLLIGPFRFCDKRNRSDCPLQEQEYKQGYEQYQSPFTLCRKERIVQKTQIYADISNETLSVLSGDDKKLIFRRLAIAIFIVTIIFAFGSSPAYKGYLWNSANYKFHIIYSVSLGVALFLWVLSKLISNRTCVAFNRATLTVSFPIIKGPAPLHVKFSDVDFFIQYTLASTRGGSTHTSIILAKPRDLTYFPKTTLHFENHFVADFYYGVNGQIDILFLICSFMRGEDITSEVEILPIEKFR